MNREIGLLDDLAARGKLNGLSGLKFLNKEELKIREPYVSATKALLVPEEGIVSYRQVMDTMAAFIKSEGGKFF
jgi:L-2-hydroxyglutarate oxidase